MRRKADNSRSIFAMHRTDLSLIPSVLAIWRGLLLVPGWSSWEQIISPTAAIFCAVRADFGRPLPDWRVTADPVLVMRLQIVFRVFKLHCFAGYLDLMALAPSPCSCKQSRWKFCLHLRCCNSDIYACWVAKSHFQIQTAVTIFHARIF